MSLKLAGSSSGRTKVQGPSWVFERNQRPDNSRYMLPVESSRSHGVSVLSTYSSLPPSSDCQAGLPCVTMSSVGTFAVTIPGGASGWLSSISAPCMACRRSAGGELVGVHGPIGSLASYQNLPLDSQWLSLRFLRTTTNGVLSTRS